MTTPTSTSTSGRVARAQRRWPRASALRGTTIVTIDCDGTVYDPWACCGIRGNYRSDTHCTHQRDDILARIEQAIATYNATPVILSYRLGQTAATISWLADIGVAVAGHTELDDPRFTVAAVLTPDSDDTAAVLATSPTPTPSGVGGHPQTTFKVRMVTALHRLGATVAASFDDSGEVIAALAAAGVTETVQAPHLVKVARHEWAAGYLGAPVPAPATSQTVTSGWDTRWDDGPRLPLVDWDAADTRAQPDVPTDVGSLCPYCHTLLGPACGHCQPVCYECDTDLDVAELLCDDCGSGWGHFVPGELTKWVEAAGSVLQGRVRPSVDGPGPDGCHTRG